MKWFVIVVFVTRGDFGNGSRVEVDNRVDSTSVPMNLCEVVRVFCFGGDVQMTSALRGREGVSQILTKGRKVV